MALFESFTKPPEPEAPASNKLTLPMELLVPDPNNERKTFANMDGLIASIRNVGIIEPPVVRPLSGGKYQLLTGHRRWAAAKHLGFEELEVVLRTGDEKEDSVDTRLKSLVSNLQREAVPPLELAETLQGLLDEPNGLDTQRQLASYLGKSESWVSDTLSLLRFDPALQAKLRGPETKVPLDAVSKIARVDNPEQQANLLQQALSGTPSKKIRELIRKDSNSADTMPPTTAEKPTKPKRSFHTQQHAVVIIQSLDTESLTPVRQQAALQEAFEQIEKAA